MLVGVAGGGTCTTPLMACCMKRMAMSMPNSSPENLVNLVMYSHMPANHVLFHGIAAGAVSEDALGWPFAKYKLKQHVVLYVSVTAALVAMQHRAGSGPL